MANIKLQPRQVRAIRYHVRVFGTRYRILAHCFGISTSQVGRIVKGENHPLE